MLNILLYTMAVIVIGFVLWLEIGIFCSFILSGRIRREEEERAARDKPL